MEKFIQFVKKHGRAIVEIIGVFGIIIALSQLYLQQEQFTYEQSQKPQLAYYYELNLSDVNKNAISQAAQQLTEEFFETAKAHSIANPEKSFSEIAHEILPIITIVPAKPLSVIVTIKNTGEATATDVRIFIETDRPFTSIDISYEEPYEIKTEDGKVSIEIDRIVAGDTVTITLESTQANETLQDKLVVDYPKYLSSTSTIKVNPGQTIQFQHVSVDSVTLTKDELAITYNNILNSSYGDFMPQVGYVSAEQPALAIKITSNEGSAVFDPTIGQQ